jgi:hypothetical protein
VPADVIVLHLGRHAGGYAFTQSGSVDLTLPWSAFEEELTHTRMRWTKNNRLSVWLFCIALLAYGLIFSGLGNWNTMSRIGLSVSLADRGSLYIDDFAALTEDRAKVGNHFASDKAPGLSFLALPAVAATVRIVRLLDPDAQWVRETPETPADHVGWYPTSHLKWVLWLATLTTSSVYTALAVVALFRIALLLNVTVKGALFGAIIYGFATPTWGWATTFFSHAACGAFLVFGLWIVIVGSTPGPQWSKTRTAALGLAAGLLLGTAMVIEYPAALAALLIAAYAVWRSRRLTPDRTILGVGGAVVGALIAGIPLMLYNNAVFGSAFSLSYSFSEWHVMQQGLWGLHWPNPLIAIKILFSGERGLLWLSPILAFTPMAWWSMETGGERGLMILCLTIFLSFLIINSGLVHWEGGLSTGPRYITPSLPFLALPFAWLWEKSGVFLRRILTGMAILSSIVCFAMASIEVYTPDDLHANVVMEILLPKLASGQVNNLIVNRIGISPAFTLALYVVVIGGGIATLWRYTDSKASAILKDVSTKSFT